MEFSRTRWRRPGGGPGGEARGRQPWHGPPQPPSPASCVLTRLLPQPRNKAPALLAVSGSQVRWDTFPAQPGPLTSPQDPALTDASLRPRTTGRKTSPSWTISGRPYEFFKTSSPWHAALGGAPQVSTSRRRLGSGLWKEGHWSKCLRAEPGCWNLPEPQQWGWRWDCESPEGKGSPLSPR